ncbi:hypothetical protein CJF32_00003638 [Rutstroemia sp. NJR-2017a WRK4]|nr:hypothetical protein CJF32_00003638 [Rutstroemia sp. NJR-2017a WRK4]
MSLMEGQPLTSNSQYQYQSAQWSRLVQRNTLADSTSSSSPSITGSPQLPTQLIPILLPQQPLFHQQQLAQYNRLISSSRGSARLQTTPLPPLLSAQHIQAVPGQRSTASGVATERKTKPAARGGHGNRDVRKSNKGERALITEKDTPTSATMPGKKFELTAQLPSRPVVQHQNSSVSQQSNSVPSTPHQHARQFSFESREPSPNANSGHSPRSAYSESNITLPSKRPPPAPRRGCQYETAMAYSRRRMAYSLGTDRLEKLKDSDIQSKLSEEGERKLSTDMRELYDRLLPTPESEEKRRKLVAKLENLFNKEWPGHDIKVHVFGSSGNLLCTDESDVDICITTDWKVLEGVCMIAELLAKSGMQKVICVSTARVPIVKIFDPELKLFCDMNVNNTLALENTRMIKTYVEIDPRVRPLAMIIKHWTKSRVVNDAAFGGTLSSYTWICMIINFLQSRDPPILPALHQRPHLKLPAKDGSESSFADDIDALKGFGSKNQATLGELLFQFFRFYAHEFDYEKLVVSVRSGKQISKQEKGWSLATNNMLCVEEPFNVNRNLGNTADDFSFRGHRGGRHNNNHNRTSNSNRRSSNSNYDNPGYVQHGTQPNVSQDQWVQQQAQAQLHNHLYTTYSILQTQENQLRLQLMAQSFEQQQAHAHAQAQAYVQAQSRIQGNGHPVKQQATDRSRTSSFDQAPLTAPLRPADMYFYPLQYPGTPIYSYHASSTNPSSPQLTAAVPELRRSMHRSSATNGSSSSVGQSNGSIRSHSQPGARTAPSPLSLQGNGMPSAGTNGLGIYQQPSRQQVNGAPVPSFIADEASDISFDGRRLATTPPEMNAPKEYVGYYVNEPQPSHLLPREVMQPLAIPSFGDLNQNRRRLSTDQLPPSIRDRIRRPSRSPSPLGHDRTFSSTSAAPVAAVTSQQSIPKSNARPVNGQGPLVVNGSSSSGGLSSSWETSAASDASVFEDRSSQTRGSIDSMSGASATGSDASAEGHPSGQVTPKDPRYFPIDKAPLVVNGSTGANPAAMNGTHSYQTNGLSPADYANGNLRLSPNSQNKLTRNIQAGGMSPLDIAIGQNDLLREEFTHLSPVYEARTPSPTVNRKNDSGSNHKVNGSTNKSDTHKSEQPKTNSKLSGSTEVSSKQNPQNLKANGHTRAAKSEGNGPGGSHHWQKINKGKKRGPPSEAKNTNGQSHGEKPPSNVSERKGG